MNKPLILVDGSSYFFRAFHALPPLTTSKGQATGAAYGVANMVKRLLKDYPASPIAIIFDAKGKTFRDEWYPEYKAHRKTMPEELSSQFQPLLDLLEAMGLPILTIPGVEADDVIGTLANQAALAGQDVLISTSDKDIAQLVNAHVSLINTMTNQYLDSEAVLAKFGVLPQQIIDYLTLVGDTSDNIPGVPKCGPKTAAKWLHDYQTLDNLLANAEKISGKIGDYLRASFDHLPLSRKLVTIRLDVPLPVTHAHLTLKEPDFERLIALTRQLEFKSWLNELLSLPTSQKNQVSEVSSPLHPQYQLITSEEALIAFLKQRQETTSLCLCAYGNHADAFKSSLIGLGLGLDAKTIAYIPLQHTETSLPQLSKTTVIDLLKPLFENAAIQKIGHDLKYSYHLLKQEGIALAGIAFDTMLESYVLNSNASKHDKASLVLKYLGHKLPTYEDLTGKGSKRRAFSALNINEAGDYVAECMQFTCLLHQTLSSLLPESLKQVLTTIEMPLVSVLAKMEERGVLIDQETLAYHGQRLKVRLQELETEAIHLATKKFNLNSPKQLQEVLFEELALPVLTKTPKGQPSTAEAVLQELALDYRLPKVILEYRSLSKLVSTYIDALPKCIHQTSKRVHTCYNQAIAATGRLSSSDPNLQNIPIRSEEGRLIRKAFIAPASYKLIAADYSQIELRIMAHLSKDKNLSYAFQQGWDIHAATASEIFQTPLNEVSSEQRRRSKAINFGLIYGMSSFGLAKQLGISRQEAHEYMTRYFERYPGVFQYMETIRQLARQQGYVETLFGRRLYLPEINASNKVRQTAAERMAINAPMQGTAADIIKKAMLAIDAWLSNLDQSQVSMIMQVHDELIFEVHTEFVETALATIRQLMETTVTLDVPLQVSIHAGSHWDEAH